MLLMFTIMSSAQSSIVSAGGETEKISYTLGNNLVELQIPVVKEVSLSTPTFEVPVESHKPKPNTKRKSLFEKIVDFIKKLFNT